MNRKYSCKKTLIEEKFLILYCIDQKMPSIKDQLNDHAKLFNFLRLVHSSHCCYQYFAETYLEPSQTYVMELSCENIQQLLAFEVFLQLQVDSFSSLIVKISNVITNTFCMNLFAGIV